MNRPNRICKVPNEVARVGDLVTPQRMERPQYFDDEELELEVLHDLGFPRLRLQRSGEVVSVAMAARVLYLLRTKHSSDCIVHHVQEEFNRELEPADVEDILQEQFDTTDEILMEGHRLIRSDPAVAAPGYARGRILPSGIVYEIIEIRSKGPSFIQEHVKSRWGLSVTLRTIEIAIHDWEQDLLARRNASPNFIAPDRVRPVHDGYHISELATARRNRPRQQNDGTPFRFAPPRYEPAPLTLPHPREVRSSDGHHPPFFPPGQAPSPPAYNEGVRPPPYEPSRPESEPLTSNAASQQSVSAPAFLPSLIEESAAAAFEGKPEHWPRLPGTPRMYSRTNVMDYLLDDIESYTLFPNGLGEPVKIKSFPLKNMKRFMSQKVKQRRGSLQDAERYWGFMIPKTSKFHPPFQILPDLIPCILNELAISGCETSRRVFTEFGDIPPSFAGFCFLVNHMRLSRGAPEIMSTQPSSFIDTIVIELLLSSNYSVKKVMGRRVLIRGLPTRSCPLQERADLLSEVKAERKNHPQVKLDISYPESGMARLVGLNPIYHAWNSNADFAESWLSNMSNERAAKYCGLLKLGHGLSFAMLEAHTRSDFELGRALLEGFLRRSARKAGKDSLTNADLQRAAAFIHSLETATEALATSSDWFAAVANTAALARVIRSPRSSPGEYDICRMWLTIPSLITAKPQSLGAWTSKPVNVPPCTVLTIPPFRSNLLVEWNRHSQSLKRLRNWNVIVRLWPLELPTIDALIEEFRSDFREMSMRWTDLGMLTLPKEKLRLHIILCKIYFTELRKLRLTFFQILASAKELNDPTRRAYAPWLVQHNRKCTELCRLVTQIRHSSVAASLDFARARDTVGVYYQDFESAVDWYNSFRMRPLEPCRLDQRLHDARAAVAELEAAEVRAQRQKLDKLVDRLEETSGREIISTQSEEIRNEQYQSSNTRRSESTVTNAEPEATPTPSSDQNVQELSQASSPLASESSQAGTEAVEGEIRSGALTELVTATEKTQPVENALHAVDSSSDERSIQEEQSEEIIPGDVVLPGRPTSDVSTPAQNHRVLQTTTHTDGTGPPLAAENNLSLSSPFRCSEGFGFRRHFRTSFEADRRVINNGHFSTELLLCPEALGREIMRTRDFTRELIKRYGGDSGGSLHQPTHIGSWTLRRVFGLGD